MEKKSSSSSNADLIKRIDKLENCLEHVATLTGNGNTLIKYGYDRWIPSAKEIRRK